MAGFDVSVQSIQEAEPCLLSGPYNNPGVLDLARPRDTMPMPCLF